MLTPPQIRQLLAAGRFAEAEDAIVQAMKLGQVPPAARVLLGASLAKQMRNEEAIGVLKTALAEDGASIEGWNWLSVAYRNMGRYADAHSACEAALKVRPGDIGTRFNLALGCVAARAFQEAADHLEAVVAASPQNAQALQMLGVAYEGLGKDAEAEDCFRRSAKLAPGVPAPSLSLGMLLWRRGRPQEAARVAGELLQSNPESIDAHFLASKAHMMLGHAAESRRHLETILRLDPENGLALGTLGTQLQVEGDFAAARASFERALEINPGEGLAFWGLVQGGGNPPTESAIEHAENPAVGLEARSYLLYGLGKLKEDAGSFEEAFQFYVRANELAAELSFRSRPYDASVLDEQIDAIRRIFTREVCADHTLADPSNRPIFIIGMIRSGTTLMEQILSAHPDVCAGGEIRFWLDEGALAIDPASGRIDTSRTGRLVDDYLVKLEELCPDSLRFTDKMPDNLLMAGLIHRVMPNAKFVLMRRHPIDNWLSIYTTPFAFPPDYAHDLQNIARAHAAHSRLAAHWFEVLPPGTITEVSYEELSGDPEPVIRGVLAHCGLEWNDRCLRPQDNFRSVNTPSVWQVRQPIYRSSVERWRRFEPWLSGIAAT